MTSTDLARIKNPLYDVGALICYGNIPSDLRENPVSPKFTFSKQYRFMINQGHLVTQMENDLQEISKKNKAIAIVIEDNSKVVFNHYISSVSLTAKLIFNL